MMSALTHKPNVLVVDDDPFFLEYITSCLDVYDVMTCETGESVKNLKYLSTLDLIILDIHLESISGYDICEKVRSQNLEVPILFVSSMTDLNARLTAYGVGGNDYISKPFQAEELQFKAHSLIKGFQRTKALSSSLDENAQLVLDVQKDAFNLQAINRFILSSSQCKDLESLTLVFMHALKELGSDGVLQIQTIPPVSSTGGVSRLEHEIISMSDKLSRIYQFGQGRAFYNWKNCKLLIRRVGGLIDILAILMDSMEVCIERLSTESKLLKEVTLLEESNRRNKGLVEGLLEGMVEAINDELLTLGVVSSLDPDEEERIKDIMSDYSSDIRDCFSQQDLCGNRLRETLKAMQSESSQFREFLSSIKQEETGDSGVDLF